MIDEGEVPKYKEIIETRLGLVFNKNPPEVEATKFRDGIWINIEFDQCSYQIEYWGPPFHRYYLHSADDDPQSTKAGRVYKDLNSTLDTIIFLHKIVM